MPMVSIRQAALLLQADPPQEPRHPVLLLTDPEAVLDLPERPQEVLLLQAVLLLAPPALPQAEAAPWLKGSREARELTADQRGTEPL